MLATKEHFWDKKPDCFSKKNFRVSDEISKLYRSQDGIDAHVDNLRKRLLNVTLESFSDDEFLLKKEWDNLWVIHIEQKDSKDHDEWKGFVWWSYIPGYNRDWELFGDTYWEHFKSTDNFVWQWYWTILYLTAWIMLAKEEQVLHSDTLGTDSVKWIWNTLISSHIAFFDSDNRLFKMDNKKLEEYFM